MASEKSTYTYEGLTGWKSLRPLRLFRGMYYDVKRVCNSREDAMLVSCFP